MAAEISKINPFMITWSFSDDEFARFSFYAPWHNSEL